MSSRDNMDSKNPKKRTHSQIDDTSESKNSFVNTVRSRVSGLLPTRVADWFTPSETIQTAVKQLLGLSDCTDSSDDETEEKQIKRKRFNPPDSHSLQSTETLFRTDSSETPSKRTSVYNNISTSATYPLNDICPSTSRAYMPDVIESNAEVTSVDTTDAADKDTTFKPPLKAITKCQSEAVNRQPKFDSSNSKDDKFKHPRSNPGIVYCDGRPRFKAAFGSPFYADRTKYGGASVSHTHNYFKHKPTKEIKVRESKNPVTTNESLGKSAQNIFRLLDDCPSPSVEARRMAKLQNQDKPNDKPSPSTSTSCPKPNRQLSSAGVAAIFSLKQRSRLMASTKTARQIMASHSSSNMHNFPNYECGPSTRSVSLVANEIVTSNKIPLNIHLSLPSDPSSSTEFVLYVDKDQLEKYLQDSAGQSTSTLSTSPTQSLPNSNSEPQAASETNTTNVPLNAYRDTFKFPIPAVSPIALPQNSIASEVNEQFGTELKEPEEILQTNEVGTTVITSVPGSSKDWTCSDCWVKNKADSEKCVACSGKPPIATDKSTQKQPASVPVALPSTEPDTMETEVDWKCGECPIINKSYNNECVSCGGSKPRAKDNAPTLALVPLETLVSKNPEVDLKCENCWIKNNCTVKKCAACSGSKPGGKEPAESASSSPTKQAEKDWKCETCWIINNSSIEKCAACGGSKPGGKEVTEPAPQSISMFNKPPDTKFQELLRIQKNKWECSSCLTRNDSNKTKCQCCDTEREGPSKEITPKPYTFPKESNVSFKFGIDPNEQEKNIAKKTEQEAKQGLTVLEKLETNNNIVLAPPSNIAEPETKNKNVDKPDDDVSVVPTVTFTFGISKKTAEKPPATVLPTIEETKEAPKSAQLTSFGAQFLTPVKSMEQPIPPNSFTTILDTMPLVSAKPKLSDATTVKPLTDNNASNNFNVKTLSIADESTEKSKFSFGGEMGAAAGTTSFGTTLNVPTPAFSFGATVQNVPVVTTAVATNSIFSSSPYQQPTGDIFSGLDPKPAPSTTPIFGVRNDVSSAPIFSFGSDNNAIPFGSGFKTGGAVSDLPAPTPALLANTGAEEMASLMSGVDESGNGEPASGFRAGTQESAWPPKSDAPFGAPAAPVQAPFSFGSSNQFSRNSVSSGNGAPAAFGAPPTANAQSIFSSGSLFGNTQQPVQQSSMFGVQPTPVTFGAQATPVTFGAQATPVTFGAQATPAAFGAQSQPTVFGTSGPAQPSPFSASAPTQQSAFNSPSQQSTFGVPSQSPASAFGAPAQNQPLAFGASNQSQSQPFGAPTQSQVPTFGAPTQNQSSAFGLTHSQSRAFGASPQSQPSAFGASVPNQPAVFGASAQSPAQQSSQPFQFGPPTANVFSFGQQAPAPMQSNVYNFGAGNAMGEGGMGSGMMVQSMDGTLAGGAQFTMGSAPAASPRARPMRKAVRRVPQR